jgi:predicted secreted Zn-dependent protease
MITSVGKRATALALVIIAAGAAELSAAPKVSQKTSYYKVSATSIPALIDELNRSGPQGHWAYTSWYVKWTGSCKLSVDIAYTLPKHGNPSAMPADVRRKWDAMIDALTRHEHQHGGFGVSAAQEIERAGCKNGDAIIAKYASEEKKFDKRTNHGIKDGATLK